MPGQHHINYSTTDIERYLKGEMSSFERHQLEKAALDDPFLADAIEGYTSTSVNIQPDLQELRDRLVKREETARVIAFPKQRNSGFPWLRAAAMIIILLIAGWAVYQFAWNNDNREIAQTPDTTRDSVPPVAEAPASTPSYYDSNSKQNDPTVNNIPAEKITPTNTTAKTKEPLKQTTQANNPTVRDQDSPPAVDIVSTVPASKKDDDKKLTEPANTEVSNQKDIAKEREAAEEQRNEIARSAKKADANAAINSQKQRAANQDSGPNMANSRVFRGQVTDENNNPLPFVNITNTRDNVGTYSDARGNFALISTDSVLDVQVRSLGYENTRTLLSDEEETNRIALHEDRNITARVLDTVKRNYSRVRGSSLKFEEPEPADGWDYYDSYLVNNLNVPETFVRKRADQGGGAEVELSFEVNRHGEPINIRVEKSLCEQCDKEAIRLIKQGPKWKRKARKRTRVMVPFN